VEVGTAAWRQRSAVAVTSSCDGIIDLLTTGADTGQTQLAWYVGRTTLRPLVTHDCVLVANRVFRRTVAVAWIGARFVP
jgi:hypothetical protein